MHCEALRSPRRSPPYSPVIASSSSSGSESDSDPEYATGVVSEADEAIAAWENARPRVWTTAHLRQYNPWLECVERPRSRSLGRADGGRTYWLGFGLLRYELQRDIPDSGDESSSEEEPGWTCPLCGHPSAAHPPTAAEVAFLHRNDE